MTATLRGLETVVLLEGECGVGGVGDDSAEAVGSCFVDDVEGFYIWGLRGLVLGAVEDVEEGVGLLEGEPGGRLKACHEG